MALLLTCISHPHPDVSRHSPVVEVVRLAGPAVVNISTSSRQTPFTQRGDLFDAWEQFFKHRQDLRRQRRVLGFWCNNRQAWSHILTNEHVVSGAEKITVSLSHQRPT